MEPHEKVHEKLRALVSAHGASILERPEDLRAALDDYLAEDEIAPGDLHLLVDAVRFGAYERLVSLLDHVADPAAAVREAATELARARGSDETRARWAVAALGYAGGRLDTRPVDPPAAGLARQRGSSMRRPATDPSRLERALVALGVALLITAVTLSGFYTRADGEIDWTNYLVGIAATLVLLGVGVAFWIRAAPERADEVVSWPGALGVVGVGVMLWQALDNSAATAYVVGSVMVVLAVIGYLGCRQWPFVLVAIGGFAVFYIQLFVDAFDEAGVMDDDGALVVGAGILVFTLLVSIVTWVLPERVVAGVVVGVAAVCAYFVTLYWLMVLVPFQYDGGGEALARQPQRSNPLENDVWFILVFSLVLAAGWAWAAWRTGHVGYRLLIVAICTAVVPPATVALAVEHPTYWGAVLGLLGTGALGWLLLPRLVPSLRRPT